MDPQTSARVAELSPAEGCEEKERERERMGVYAHKLASRPKGRVSVPFASMQIPCSSSKQSGVKFIGFGKVNEQYCTVYRRNVGPEGRETMAMFLR